MKIIQRPSSNPTISIIELIGGLNALGALTLKDWLLDHLDENRCINGLIMNFSSVTKIDGLGIYTLEYFINRGVDIRFVTVKPSVISMLRMATKKNILNRIYRYVDCVKAVSMFEKEKQAKGTIKMRRHPRTNTLFPVDFKYLSDSDSVVLCNGKGLNLSESGLFASEIKGVELKKKRLSTEKTL